MKHPNSKRAVALLYFPNSKPESAEKHLMVWIKRCKPLLELLRENGYQNTNKVFTPKELELVFNYLGDP